MEKEHLNPSAIEKILGNELKDLLKKDKKEKAKINRIYARYMVAHYDNPKRDVDTYLEVCKEYRSFLEEIK